MMDIKKEQRKLKRATKSASNKTLGIVFLICVLSLVPSFGTLLAIAATL